MKICQGTHHKLQIKVTKTQSLDLYYLDPQGSVKKVPDCFHLFSLEEGSIKLIIRQLLEKQ
jgi:hypothetical protein